MPEDRRAELIAAAERVITAQGGTARVEDVIREAGTAKGTFYLYFPSWDDLLAALRTRIIADFKRTHPIPSAGSEEIHWSAELERQATAFIDAVLAMGGLHEALFHSDFAARRPMSDDEHPVGHLAGLIRSGVAAGAFADSDPIPTAHLLFAATHEAADLIAAGENRERVLAALRPVLGRSLARNATTISTVGSGHA